MADPKALATAGINTQGLMERATFRSRPTGSSPKPRGYGKDINLPADKPKAMTSGRSMSKGGR